MPTGTIVSVQEIKNVNLLERYELEKKQLTRKLGKKPKEAFLWHGSSNTDPKIIY